MKNLIQKIKHNRLSVAEQFIVKVFKEMREFKNDYHTGTRFWSWGGHTILELDIFSDLYISKICLLDKLAETNCFGDYKEILEFVKSNFSEYKKIQVVGVQDDRYSNF